MPTVRFCATTSVASTSRGCATMRMTVKMVVMKSTVQVGIASLDEIVLNNIKSVK